MFLVCQIGKKGGEKWIQMIGDANLLLAMTENARWSCQSLLPVALFRWMYERYDGMMSQSEYLNREKI